MEDDAEDEAQDNNGQEPDAVVGSSGSLQESPGSVVPVQVDLEPGESEINAERDDEIHASGYKSEGTLSRLPSANHTIWERKCC